MIVATTLFAINLRVIPNFQTVAVGHGFESIDSRDQIEILP